MRTRRAAAPNTSAPAPAVATPADMIARLASAARTLETIDSEIARLVEQKRTTEAEIRGIAHEVVADGAGSATSRSSNGRAANGAATKSAEIPPRYRKLLSLLGAKPDADYGYFCTEIYQRVDRSARINISSAFSHLKTDGFVEAMGPGRFRLTDKGKQAIQ